MDSYLCFLHHKKIMITPCQSHIILLAACTSSIYNYWTMLTLNLANINYCHKGLGTRDVTSMCTIRVLYIHVLILLHLSDTPSPIMCSTNPCVH